MVGLSVSNYKLDQEWSRSKTKPRVLHESNGKSFRSTLDMGIRKFKQTANSKQIKSYKRKAWGEI